jgi:hypothetical protein
MSSQPESKKNEIINVRTLWDNLKNGKWKYVISVKSSHSKGSTMLKTDIIDSTTNFPINDGKKPVFRANGVIFKNGPYMDTKRDVPDGKRRLPDDIMDSISKKEKYFKTDVTLGTKSSGVLGEFTEWFADTIWTTAVKDVAVRLNIDSADVIIPYPICKKTYGSNKNTPDPEKKKAYMDAADWRYAFKIRGNTTESMNCFGFKVYTYEKYPDGTINRRNIPVTAFNVCEWFRRGVSGTIDFSFGDVTLVSDSTVNKFYHGRNAIKYTLKRESQEDSEDDMDEEEKSALASSAPAKQPEPVDNSYNADDERDSEYKCASTSDDIEAQMSSLGV